MAEEKGVIAGIEEVIVLFNEFGISTNPLINDGETIEKIGSKIITLEGPMRTILTCERTALNFLMRMSGIATITRKLVSMVKKVNSSVRIAATRKTLPLLSYFDKKAVHLGGGDTHRHRLDDCVLIKDNHIKLLGDIEKIIKITKEKLSFTKKIEIEVESPEDCLVAAQAGADIIMLDNMNPLKIKESLDLLKKNNLRDKVIIEVSGGINEENIIDYAKTNIDIISLGKITHSVKALNLKLEIVD
jgi:nicotinate-nucleotide pyrophosphorylase (carboxylating)